MSTSTFRIVFDGAPDDADTDARDLRAFLSQDSALRGRVENRLVPPGQGEMGGVADAVQYAVELGPLVLSPLGIWLTARLRKGKVSLTLHRPDGTELKVSADDLADAEALLDRVEGFFDPEPAPTLAASEE